MHTHFGIWSLCVLLTAPALAGCLSPSPEAALPTSPAGVQEPGAAPPAGAPASSPFPASGPDPGEPATSQPPASPAPEHASYSLTLPTILATRTIDPKLGFGGFFSVEGRRISLSVPPYSLPLDPRGIANFEDVKRVLQPGAKEAALLFKNGITVHGGRSWDDIVQPYKFLAWNKVPIFVTTDTVLHLYHILFDSTLKTLEEEQFHPAAIGLSQALFQASASDQGSLSGEPQEAARRNVAYFAVALRLLNQNVEVPAYVAQDVERELDLIRDHSGFSVSPIFGYCEDYSQYVPRGHYTRSEALQQYFRAFMWFGRMAFLLRGDAPPSLDCSTPGPSGEDARVATAAALLLAEALNRTTVGTASAREAWERIYTVTAFFVGLADDLTPLDYLGASRVVYAQPLTREQLADEAKRVAFKGELAKMPSPAIFGGTGICVLPAGEALEETDLEACLDRSKGMRFMGQRFIPDSYMFQNLVLPVVGEYHGSATPFTQCQTPDGRFARCFPRGLDVAAVLGSERALKILERDGDTSYENYTAALLDLQGKFLNLTPQEWNRNLYFAWVYVLRSLLGTYGPGYPTFMRTEAWQDKDLNTFLASWTELRHDTILYAKQSYSGAVAMFHERPRVVGYVEPNAVFYACMGALTRMTRDGLEAMSALPEDLKDRFDRLENLIGRLYEISVMELANQPLSEADYDFIDDVADSLGSIAEGFDQADTRTTMVADVHTDPNTGQVLKEAVGRVRPLLVAYKVPDGRVLVGAGPVLSYYEFKHPMSDRLTDEAWVRMLESAPPAAPEWTASFQAPGG